MNRTLVMALAVATIAATVYVFLLVPETACAFPPLVALALGAVALGGSSAAYVLAGRSGVARYKTKLSTAVLPLIVAVAVLIFVMTLLLGYAFCEPA